MLEIIVAVDLLDRRDSFDNILLHHILREQGRDQKLTSA
jgi:hypothetical protein